MGDVEETQPLAADPGALRCQGCYADIVPATGVAAWRAVSGSLFCTGRVNHQPMPDVGEYIND